ncbi:UbiA prenyltransferase family-domain-containing protein [Flammula alnicola]|nr:UbiA prenyltransferase family-domain-containing protein [Flammula alnicola]
MSVYWFFPLFHSIGCSSNDQGIRVGFLQPSEDVGDTRDVFSANAVNISIHWTRIRQLRTWGEEFEKSPSISPPAFRQVGQLSPSKLLKVYGQLAKSRLTILVVLTAMSGVALSPLPATLPVLLSTALGTALCSASANTLNQIQEVPFDAQMTRTRTRPLVRRAITPMHAAGFALATGIAGPALLWTMVGPITACLGAANIALYAGLYTWMKRRSVYNTWVGSVVGALPPLMGWTACGGKLLPTTTYPVELFLPPFLTSGTITPLDLSLIDNPLAPFAFFMLLFSWQFPHFNSLSYLVRDSYAQAGYRMLSVFSPTKNALVSLRHAVLLLPICSILVPLSGLTTWMFALTTLIPNLFCVRAAWRFWRRGGEKEARVVFQHSLWYLPVMLGLMMFHKQGMVWLEWLGFTKEVETVQDDEVSNTVIQE